MICDDKVLALQWCGTCGCCYSDGKYYIMRGRCSLWQATYQHKGQQAAQSQELRCYSQRQSGEFAWAIFPFKHPLWHADQPGPNWADATASQSNQEETGSSWRKPRAHIPVTNCPCPKSWLETSQICMIHFIQSSVHTDWCGKITIPVPISVSLKWYQYIKCHHSPHPNKS